MEKRLNDDQLIGGWEPSAPSEGMWSRMRRGLRRRLATAAPAPAAVPAIAVPAVLQPFAAKVCSAAEAVARIAPGEHVFVGTASATPRTLVAALEARDPSPADVELVHFLTDQAVPHDAEGRATTRFRHRCFYAGLDMRAALRQGLADYVPISLARVPELMRIGRIPVDVALIQVSPPDAFGYVNLGISVDVTPAALARARLVIAEVNPAMPATMGDAALHVSDIDWLVPVDTPVIEYLHPAVPEAVIAQIARYIGGIIDDGSTLQIGLGRVTHEALKHLADRRDLGIHSDVITDAILPLLEQGVITGRRKTQQPGKIVTSFAMGSRRLYDLVDRNPLFSFQPIDAVCQPQVLAAQHKMVSVTQAFAVDLGGQVCAERLHGELYGGLAAQAEFLRGASRSAGGKAIVCLPSRDERGPRIRLGLGADEPATIARNDVHYVVTEWGIAYLFGKSLRERAVALIDIAHPDDREQLFAQARDAGLLPAGQALRPKPAYDVRDEALVALKDGRSVLIRPAVASDADGIRALFHKLARGDVYTRFFRSVRSLSDEDVQRLCNVDFDGEVAFVAASGPREDPTIVGHGLYAVDATTNLAETAFMVRSDWQGIGLGTALQAHLQQHAAARGVLGFVANILASNDAMIRLARAGGPDVQVSGDGETVRVVALF